MALAKSDKGSDLIREGPYLLFPHDLVDSDRAPLYVRTRYDVSAEEQDAYFVAATQFWTHLDHPVAWINDTRGYDQSNASKRAAYADYLKRVQSFQERWMVGAAVIVDSAEVRGISTSVRWLAQTKFPQLYFENVDEAFAWAVELLGERGIEV